MEGNRRFRFVIPPFVLLVSLVWGAYLNYLEKYASKASLEHMLDKLSPLFSHDVSSLVAALAAGGVIIIALGFLISAVTVGWLRLLGGLFFLSSFAMPKKFKIGHYESYISSDALCTIQKRLGIADTYRGRRWILATQAIYEFGLIYDKINDWIQRRWDTFITSTNCITALLLSLLIGSQLGLDVDQKWQLPVFALSGILFFNACFAYWQEADLLTLIADSDPKIVERQMDDEPQQPERGSPELL